MLDLYVLFLRNRLAISCTFQVCSSYPITSNRKGKGCVMSNKNWNSQENKSSYPNGKQQSFSALNDPEEEFMPDELCERVLLGRIPVMVNSSYCHTHDLSKDSLLHGNQCLFDLGGYFIIKGSEKVRFHGCVFRRLCLNTLVIIVYLSLSFKLVANLHRNVTYKLVSQNENEQFFLQP